MTEGSTVTSEETNGYVPQKNANGHVVRNKRGKERTFCLRNSLLTDLFEDPNFRVIHSLTVASFWLLLLYSLLYDHVVEKDVFKGLRLFFELFINFHYTILIWTGMNVIAWAWYVLFIAWAEVRLKLLPISNIIACLDSISLISLMAFHVASIYMVKIILVSINFPWLSRAIIIYEQIRILMKIHSFVMYSKDAVIAYKPHADQELKLPKFSHFVYFTFAPTLLYRDEYVRTKEIRVNFLISCFSETLCLFLFGLLLFGRIVNPEFEHYGLKRWTAGHIAMAIIKVSWPITLGLTMTAHLMLHSSQNFFAECLRFGDRQFYKNWWASRSMFDYFKTWNRVVYDFLLEHVYTAIAKVTGKRGKLYGKLGSFFVSAVAHEVMMAYIFNAFVPTMLLQLMTSGLLALRPNTIGNAGFWFFMFLGSSTLFGFYFMEYWARQNAPWASSGALDFFKLRMLYCTHGSVD